MDTPIDIATNPPTTTGADRVRAAHEAAETLAHELGNLTMVRDLSPQRLRLLGHASRLAASLAQMLEHAVEVAGE